MLTLKRLLFACAMTLFWDYRIAQPAAYFFIINESRDKGVVDIQVTIGGRRVFSDSIHYSNVRPDLQYTPYVRLPKGQYNILVTADSGKARQAEPIVVNSDCWIFVTYHFRAPVDSARRVGVPSTVGISSMDREPIQM